MSGSNLLRRSETSLKVVGINSEKVIKTAR